MLLLPGCLLRAAVLLAATSATPNTPPAPTPPAPTPQVSLPGVDRMPDVPAPYAMRDWRQVARDFDALAFDEGLQGEHLPLFKWDDSGANFGRRTFGFPSYVGHDGMASPDAHEAICTIASLVGATLAGIDKSSQDGHDFVSMVVEYFNAANGEDLFLNRTSATTGGTFWYELYPNVLAWQLSAQYPANEELRGHLRTVSGRLLSMVEALAQGHEDGVPDFTHTAFRFSDGQPVDNTRWVEPDAAAAAAWMLAAAHRAFGDEEFLEASRACLRFLDELPAEKNPLYEILLPFGAVTAARLNAVHGDHHKTDRLLNWIFGPAHARWGWGTVNERWGGLDVHGLAGSLTDGGGYAFAMNTYDTMAAITPIARYDERTADALAKWVLNAANASRLFYGIDLPDDHQTAIEWLRQHDPNRVLTYEGLRKEWKGKGPVAMGDPLVHGWARTDLAVYGAAHVGYLGGLVEKTDVDGILLIDLLATDFWGEPGFPTYLLRNPHAEAHWIALPAEDAAARAWGLVSNRLLGEDSWRDGKLLLAPGATEVVAILPPDGDIEHRDQMIWLDGLVVDFNDGTRAFPPPDPAFRRGEGNGADESRVLDVPRARGLAVDGDAADWEALGAEPVDLDVADRGTLRVALRFAWDEDSLYFLAQEAAPSRTPREATSAEDFAARHWDFDSLALFLDIDNSNTIEEVKDFNPWAGFSTPRRDDLLGARSHRPGPFSASLLASSHVVAQAVDGRRVIEGAIAWQDIAAAVEPARLPKEGLAAAIAPGFRFGCEPLLLDNGYRGQSFLGGEAFAVPMGDTPESLDLVLR